MTGGKDTAPQIWENQKKISSAEVKLGHYVAQLSSPWSQTPFLIQGFEIADQEELRWIRSHCEWAIIDLQKSGDTQELTAVLQHANTQATSQFLTKKPLTKKSMKASLSQYLDLSTQTLRIVEHFKDLEQIDVRKTIYTVRDIAISLTQNLPALIWLTRIKHQDQYTAEHCLNVCVLSMGLATAVGWTPKDVAQVGVAGLLHDLGKIDINQDVLNKPGKLTAEEFAEMQQHSQLGYSRLKEEPDLTDRILKGILHHHERPDGKGYPHGLSGDDIDDMAKIVSIVDAYDAITSNRIYQQARSHHEAMSILWRMRGKQFDAYLVEAFIHFLGWVTPGTLVELSSGDLAVVIQANEGQRLYPKVRILMPTNVGYTLGAVWNLLEMVPRDGEPRIHIANVLPDGHLGIRLEDFAERLID